MATVTGLTAERMIEIEGASVVDGVIVDGELVLTKHNGDEINAGSVIGPAGPQGPQGLSAIPGEVKLWPGDTLPDLATYGRWVWADGAEYPIASHPIAAAHISDLWNTFGEPPNKLPAPAAGNFRVPDLRGSVPAGMDAMPGGTRKGRMARDEAIVLAKTTGKETHALVVGEMAKHNHGTDVSGKNITVAGSISGTATNAGTHAHTAYASYDYVSRVDANNGQAQRMTGMQMDWGRAVDHSGATSTVPDHQHPVSGSCSAGGVLADAGSGTSHENVQPTVFVPYIICLDN